jgi:1,4-alpha-glucan branching enzyme
MMKRPLWTGRAAVAAAVTAGLLAAGGCFGGSGQSVSRSGPEIVEGGVIFHYYDRNAARVTVVGDFNNWSPKTDAMVDENGDGEWTLFFPLAPGVYQYKFVIDGRQWVTDPGNPEKVSDGFEGENSVLRMTAPKG